MEFFSVFGPYLSGLGVVALVWAAIPAVPTKKDPQWGRKAAAEAWERLHNKG